MELERVNTTFPTDFYIAYMFGKSAILDTYKRAFKEWKNSVQYMTELVMVLNHLCWLFYDRGEHDTSRTFSELYYKAHDYCLKHFKGDELSFYLRVTD